MLICRTNTPFSSACAEQKLVSSTHRLVHLHGADGEGLVACLALLFEVILAELHLDLVLLKPECT